MKKHYIKKILRYMFRFIKKIFIRLLRFCGSLAMKCVSMSKQPCQLRLTIVDVNSNEPLYHPFTDFVSNCSGRSIYSNKCSKKSKKKKLKSLKVFNLVSKVNKT